MATSIDMTDDEFQKPDLLIWPGWVELESEPAYFNTILKDLGVTGVQCTEVFGLDAEELGRLPQPVHGLIFLFKYKPPTREDLNAAFPREVWFARQKPHNACATFALLNIVNNIPDIQLGDRLEQFRNMTRDMTPLERGDELDQLDWVRAIHNSFATQNDLIAVDQVLQKEIQDAKKHEAAIKQKKAREARAAAKAALKPAETLLASRASGRLKAREETPGTKRKAEDEIKTSKRVKKNEDTPRKTRSRKTTSDDDAAYHFCAYMPIGDAVWKLDGLEPTPENIGRVQHDSWLDIAVPELQARIRAYADDAIDFSLMAIVRDPLSDLSQLSGAAIGDQLELAKQDAEKATHRRFDYARFVRSWMEELVEAEALSGIFESIPD